MLEPIAPHGGQQVVTTGASLEDAAAAMILVHGRGATATSILTLANEMDGTGIVYLAPQAAGNTWYPYSFLTPMESNEPGISSGLSVIDSLVELVGSHGILPERVIIGGFSQGACLASEYVARYARRYGGLIVYSGGLIGPPGTSRDYDGSLDGTPVFIGCSDVDFHIPVERVHETTQVLSKLGGGVTERIYPGMGHTVNQYEIVEGKKIVQSVLDGVANE